MDLTQEQLAQQVGCATVTIRKIESAIRRPSQQIAGRLVDALGLTGVDRMNFIRVIRSEIPLSELSPLTLSPDRRGHVLVSQLPRGTVTFLFTDIAGSTRLWDRESHAMQGALVRHNALLESIVRAYDGVIFKFLGDGACAAFSSALDALVAAYEAQRALQQEPWETTVPLQVRMALHTGDIEVHDGEYVGPPLNRISRLLAAAHGSQVLLSRTTQELVREDLPSDITLRDLGVFRLRDISTPEQIFQLLASDLPQDFPTPAALAARLTNLPPQLSSMVGRMRELDELTALFREGKRLVTITGPGGVGKTRLALQFVALISTNYPDGIWFVDLSPVYTMAQLAVRVAQVLGVADASESGLNERLQLWLRDRRLLLVLDNAEHVRDIAGMVAQWLYSAPELAVLVTSRIPLRLAGEQEYPLAPLGLPDLQALPELEQVFRYDAVALFITRVRELQPGFALTHANIAAIAEICWQLDGLPLAIELAAARVRFLTPRQLLAQLQDRGLLRLLSSDIQNLPVRQKTIEATLAWSYDLLRVPEQTLLARIGVFVSGWTLAAAESICADTSEDAQIGGERILNLLEQLVEHNLIQHVQAESASPRFAILRSIREFALQHLESRGEAPTLRRRHAELYMALAAQARTRYDAGDGDAFVTIHEDLDNLRAALDWALTHDMIEAAADTVVRLGPFWSSRMPVTLSWLEDLLAHGDQLPYALHANLLALTGSLSWEIFRDPLHARDLCQASLAIFRETRDERGIAMVLTALAHIAVAMGELDRSPTDNYLAESLAIRRRLGDRGGVAETLSVQGRFAVLHGEFARAWTLLDEVLALRRAERAPLGIAVALHYMAWLAFQQGDYERMHTISTERSVIEQTMANPQGIADCKLWLGVAALWQGNAAQALALLETSRVQLRGLGEERNLPHVLDACAHAAGVAGNASAAQMYQLERLALLKRLGVWRGMAWSHIHLGVIALEQVDVTEAWAQLRIARSIINDGRFPYSPTHLFSDLSPRRDAAALVLLIEAGAALAVFAQHAERAARLLGAAETLRRVQRLPYYFPDERNNVHTTTATVRALLGDQRFTTAWQAGQFMGLDQSMEEAFDQ